MSREKAQPSCFEHDVGAASNRVVSRLKCGHARLFTIKIGPYRSLISCGAGVGAPQRRRAHAGRLPISVHNAVYNADCWRSRPHSGSIFRVPDDTPQTAYLSRTAITASRPPTSGPSAL